jgi:hypothetical protein
VCNIIDIAISKYEIPKGSDNEVQQSGLLGFWTLSIVRYLKKHNVSETRSVSVLG